MWYRIWQSIQVITAWARPVDDALAAAHLRPDLMALFLSMPRGDRQHHLRVARRLLADGHNHPSLITAALLHDIGKSRYPFRLPDRVLAVVVKKLWPQRFARWSSAEPVGWKRALVVSAQHPDWGAERVAAVCDDRVVLDLIALHQSPLTTAMSAEVAHLLPLLQAADDVS